MNDDPEQLKILVQSFVDDPHESLAVELKEWLDPRDPKDQMQLVRTLLAFRNHADGGLLLLGIDDSKTHKPPPAGWDVRQVYSDDHIQRLVSRYASHKFDIRVLFARHGSYEYPAIVVSGGILTPVACKSDLRDPAEPNRYLLKEHDVYVRTLNTNGTVSSAKATWQDLEALVNLCSSNREANSVGFFTKLFQNLQTQDLSEILKNLSNLSEKAIDTIEGIAQLHSEGEQRFSALAEEQNVPIAGRGFFDVVLVIQGKTSEKWEADERFRSTLEVANPNLRGFPVLKVRPPHQPDTLRQQVIGEVWEQFLYLPIAGRPSSIGVLEFMILDREGRFFFRRVLEEDNDFMTELSSQGRAIHPPIGTVLHPVSQMVQVAEVLRVGTAFAEALKYNQSETSLVFDFKWIGLEGRQLRAWDMPFVTFFVQGECQDFQRQSRVQLNAGANDQQIIEKTIEALKPLFRGFGGYGVPVQSVEHWVTRLLNRQ